MPVMSSKVLDKMSGKGVLRPVNILLMQLLSRAQSGTLSQRESLGMGWSSNFPRVNNQPPDDHWNGPIVWKGENSTILPTSLTTGRATPPSSTNDDLVAIIGIMPARRTQSR
eukprot:31302-Prymnesium_polylepis.2